MLRLLTKLKTNTSGATAIEYGLIAALVAVGLITALIALETDLSALFTDVSAAMTDGTDPN
jgi:pilus assembly protein Flp/PilA